MPHYLTIYLWIFSRLISRGLMRMQRTSSWEQGDSSWGHATNSLHTLGWVSFPFGAAGSSSIKWDELRVHQGFLRDWAQGEWEVSVTVCAVWNLDSSPPTQFNTSGSTSIVSLLSLLEKFKWRMIPMLIEVSKPLYWTIYTVDI